MTSYIYNMVDTWNDGATTFTAVKMNVTDTASNAASLLMDLRVGTVSQFSVSKAGSATFGGSITATASGSYVNAAGLSLGTGGAGGIFVSGGNAFAVNSSGGFRWSSNANVNVDTNGDLILTRRAAANLRLGAADAAAPVAQTLSVQSVVAGTTNTAGTNLTITGSQGTGTGAGGDIIFQTAISGASGSAQNALRSILTISGGADCLININPSLTVGGVISAGSDKFQTIQFGATQVGSNGLGAITPSGFVIRSNYTYSWTNGTNPATGTVDLILARDAANTLALRNGTAAQLFNIYRTYTDASNYERLSVGISGSNFDISVENAGTGVARPLRVFTTTSSALQLGTVNVLRWNIDTSGHFVANADNLYDIGASGATRPRNVYVAGSVISGGSIEPSGAVTLRGSAETARRFNVNGYVSMRFPSDGVFTLLNDAGTDFGRINFGGTTSSFPALKRSSTTLQARLADDTGFASVQGKLTTETAYTAGAPTATGYLVVYDSNGTAYRIPAVLN